MEEKNIKSPFTPIVIAKTATLSETVKVLVRGFGGALKMCEDMGEKTNESTLTGYMCGCVATLHAMGFEEEDSAKIAEIVMETIKTIGKEDNDCDCDNCKQIKKQ